MLGIIIESNSVSCYWNDEQLMNRRRSKIILWINTKAFILSPLQDGYTLWSHNTVCRRAKQPTLWFIMILYYDNQDKWVNLKWITGISFSKVSIELSWSTSPEISSQLGQLEETAGETGAEKSVCSPQARKSVMVRTCDRVPQKFIDVSCSLRSTRFQSSYCAKVRAEAKKRVKG